MKCSKVKEKLLDYAYGELKPEEAVRIEQHLEGCADCASALRDLEFTRKVMRKAEARVPSNHTMEALCRTAADAVRGEEQPQEERRRTIPLFSPEVLRPFLAGAASVMLLIGIAAWIFPLGSSTPEPREAVNREATALDPAMEQDLIRRASREGTQWNDPERVVEELLRNSQQREAAMRCSLNLVLPALLEPDDRRAAPRIYKAAGILDGNGCSYEAFLLYLHLDKRYGDFEMNYEVSRKLGKILAEHGDEERAGEYYNKSLEQESERNPIRDA